MFVELYESVRNVFLQRARLDELPKQSITFKKQSITFKKQSITFNEQGVRRFEALGCL